MEFENQDTITIFNNGIIHLIDKEPNENISDTYKRGWFIIKNIGESNYNKLYSLSIIANNKNKGMIYL
jgi:hypothetical protein